MFSFYEFFTDPVLRAPTIGSMLMCLSASLVGVVVFLRKESLIGETLSHSSYPGVVAGMLALGVIIGDVETGALLQTSVLVGAALTALIGLACVYWLERSLKLRPDSALCFVLSVFFGFGLLLASQAQFSFSYLYKQIQIYLYGQAATMTDLHIVIYGVLATLVILSIGLFYRELEMSTFDRAFAKSMGVPVKRLDALFAALVVLAVVVGIRSVGVVLMSAMLIAPAAAARQFTHSLKPMFFLAGVFGIVSAFVGNILAVKFSDPTVRLTMPTGPMIVLFASLICLFALLFSPTRGAIFRLVRAARFRYQCLVENILKFLWRGGGCQNFSEIYASQHIGQLYLYFILRRLKSNRWVEKNNGQYCLTKEGSSWAKRIVRLHRLWEVYLADYLGVGAEKVHRSAEEMEHIITPELEQELTLLLKDPKEDPHHQPIPPRIEL